MRRFNNNCQRRTLGMTESLMKHAAYAIIDRVQDVRLDGRPERGRDKFWHLLLCLWRSAVSCWKTNSLPEAARQIVATFASKQLKNVFQNDVTIV